MTIALKYSTPTAIALFLLSPLLALPYIILGIYRGEKSAYFLFSLFLGFLAWLQIPYADLFRHTMNAYNYYGKPFERVFNNSDFIVPLANWILMNNHIPYQFFRLLYVTESFFLLTIIFNYMINVSSREYTQKEVFERFCILFCFFEFIQTTVGVRYGFALYQYIFALHLLINKKSYIAALIFAFLATKIHESFYFFIPISIILYVCCRSRKTSIILLICLTVIAVPIIGRFSFLLGRRADWYFGGGTSISGNTFGKVTIYGFILFTAIRLFLLPFAFLVIKYFDSSSKWVRFAMVWLILFCVFITNSVMIFRIAFIFATIGVFLLLAIEMQEKLHTRVIRIILWCGIMTTVLNAINYRTYILESKYQYIAMPTFVILQNQYERQWIIEHVKGNTIVHKH